MKSADSALRRIRGQSLTVVVVLWSPRRVGMIAIPPSRPRSPRASVASFVFLAREIGECYVAVRKIVNEIQSRKTGEIRPRGGTGASEVGNGGAEPSAIPVVALFPFEEAGALVVEQAPPFRSRRIKMSAKWFLCVSPRPSDTDSLLTPEEHRGRSLG